MLSGPGTAPGRMSRVLRGLGGFRFACGSGRDKRRSGGSPGPNASKSSRRRNASSASRGGRDMGAKSAATVTIPITKVIKMTMLLCIVEGEQGVRSWCMGQL